MVWTFVFGGQMTVFLALVVDRLTGKQLEDAAAAQEDVAGEDVAGENQEDAVIVAQDDDDEEDDDDDEDDEDDEEEEDDEGERVCMQHGSPYCFCSSRITRGDCWRMLS